MCCSSYKDVGIIVTPPCHGLLTLTKFVPKHDQERCSSKLFHSIEEMDVPDLSKVTPLLSLSTVVASPSEGCEKLRKSATTCYKVYPPGFHNGLQSKVDIPSTSTSVHVARITGCSFLDKMHKRFS